MTPKITPGSRFLNWVLAIATVVGCVFTVLGYLANQALLEELTDYKTGEAAADSLARVENVAANFLPTPTTGEPGQQDTTPPPQPPPPTRYFLRLISLRCDATEDNAGEDEPYLEVWGEEVWSGDMNEDDTEELGLEFEFTESITVALYDEDTGVWFDTDDYLGKKRFRRSDATPDPEVHTFRRDGAIYQLTYQVVGR